MTFGSGPEGTETHRRSSVLATAVVDRLSTEDGTALVVRHKSNRTPVRKVAAATDKYERVAGVLRALPTDCWKPP